MSDKNTVTRDHRDILKVYDDTTLMVICGIENQDELHLAMPLRHMLYDALQYLDEYQAN